MRCREGASGSQESKGKNSNRLHLRDCFQLNYVRVALSAIFRPVSHSLAKLSKLFRQFDPDVRFLKDKSSIFSKIHFNSQGVINLILRVDYEKYSHF